MSGRAWLAVNVGVRLASISAFGLLSEYDAVKATAYWQSLSDRQRKYYLDQAEALIELIKREGS